MLCVKSLVKCHKSEDDCTTARPHDFTTSKFTGKLDAKCWLVSWFLHVLFHFALVLLHSFRNMAARRTFSTVTKAVDNALKHRPVMNIKGAESKVWLSPNAFVPPSATVIGDVEIMGMYAPPPPTEIEFSAPIAVVVQLSWRCDYCRLSLLMILVENFRSNMRAPPYMLNLTLCRHRLLHLFTHR
jgi:hypothetical protein